MIAECDVEQYGIIDFKQQRADCRALRPPLKERQGPERSGLLPLTHALLRDVEARTGRPVVVRADPAVRDRGRAIYVVSDPDPSRHLVLYDPAERRHLDHLVIHEIGHLRAFSDAAPEERTVPVLTERARLRAITQLGRELERLVERGVPERLLPELLPIWLSGTVAQLVDTPADIAIELDMSNSSPGLRSHQRASLEAQAIELHRVLLPQVRAVTPPSIWLASNAMNYALLRSVGRFLNEPWMWRPYAGTVMASVGDELLALGGGVTGTDLAANHALSGRWAGRLGFRGWFEWRRLDELPGDSKHAIE